MSDDLNMNTLPTLDAEIVQEPETNEAAGLPAEETPRQPVFPDTFNPYAAAAADIPRETQDMPAEKEQAVYYSPALTAEPEPSRIGPDGNEAGERAGFWPRLFAGIIDLVVTAFIWLLFTGIAGIFTDRLNEPFFFSTPLIKVLFILASAVYNVAMGWICQATFGKRALKLRIISSDTFGKPDAWTIFFRETFGKYLSCVTVIGLLMVFGKKHLPLHDRLADTEVVYDLKKAQAAAASEEPAEHTAEAQAAAEKEGEELLGGEAPAQEV